MRQTQLRKWMHKYGNWGVLMIACYLGLKHLCRYRKGLLSLGIPLASVAVAILCLLSLPLQRLHPPLHPNSNSVPSNPNLVSPPTSEPSIPGTGTPLVPFQGPDLLDIAQKITRTDGWELPDNTGVDTRPYMTYYWPSNNKVLFFHAYDGMLCQYDTVTGNERAFHKVSAMMRQDGNFKKQIEISPDGQWILWEGDYDRQFGFTGYYGAKWDGSHRFHIPYYAVFYWMPDSRHFLEVNTYDPAKSDSNVPVQTLIRSVEMPQNRRTSSHMLLPFSNDLQYYASQQLRFLPGNRLLNIVSQEIPGSRDQYTLDEYQVDANPRRLHHWMPVLPNTVESTENAISPQGNRIAWVVIPSAENPPTQAALYISRMDGSDLQEVGQLALPSFEEGTGPSFTRFPHELKWLPDGKHLSFIYQDVLYTVPAFPFPQSMLIVPRFWKDNPFRGSISELNWSPDGEWVYYWLSEDNRKSEDETITDETDRESLCCIRRDGTHARRLYSDLRLQEGAEVIRWAPDNRHLLCWQMLGFGSSINADGSTLFDVDVRDGKRRVLSTDDRHREEAMMREPDTLTFSPDGKYLLLVQGGGRFWLTNKRLARVEYATGKRTWLTEPTMAATLPEWSPDGRRIAFIATPDPGTYSGDPDDIVRREAQKHLWVTCSDGTGKRQLTLDRHYHETDPHWQGNGKQIEFVREEDTSSEDTIKSLWAIRLDGTHLRKIRSLPKDETQ